MKEVAVLIPTINRTTALAATLTSLCAQEYKDFDVVISDQTETDIFDNPSIVTLLNILTSKGHNIKCFRNLPRKGISENRQFLLDKSSHKYSLFLDDDLILEPYVIGGMVKILDEQKCGFVGRAPIGLSYRYDFRVEEQNIEFWDGTVRPENIEPFKRKWERHLLHNAANILHVERRFKINADSPLKYKIAWIGGCVLYDSKKLKLNGGFNFWKKLSHNHAGEDVLVQNILMQKYGGCGILPSGVYHQELPTTIHDRRQNAIDLYKSI